MPHPFPRGKFSGNFKNPIDYWVVMSIIGSERGTRKQGSRKGHEMKYTIIVDEYQAMGDRFAVGDKVLVLLKEDFNSGEEWYTLSKTYAETGYPGNIDHNEFRFHGWRGTTNNIAVTACGVYEIKKVQELEDYKVKITIGRKDLKKGEE